MTTALEPDDFHDLEVTLSNNRRLAFRSVLVFVVLIAITSFIAFGGKHQTVARTGSGANLPPATINVTDVGFVPATISVKPGQTVVWNNVGQQMHEIASDNPLAKSSDEISFNSDQALASQDSVTYVFDKAGTYGYHDKTSTLRGTVIVD